MEKETKTLCKNFAKTLYDNLTKRFVQKELISTFKIFSVKRIRMLSPDDLSSYGRHEIENLIKHFGIEKFYLNKTFSAIINPETIRNEWRILKHIISTTYLNRSDNEIWPLIYSLCKDKHPNITKLIALKGILLFTTVK